MKEMAWKELNEYINEARKDPVFMEDLHEFIRQTTGKAKKRRC